MSKVKKILRLTHTSHYIFADRTEREFRDDTMVSMYRIDDFTYILAYDLDLGGRTVTTTLKISQDTVSIVTIGELHCRQTYTVKKGTNNQAVNQYFYSGHSLKLNNYTTHFDYQLDLHVGGFIDLFYTVYLDDQPFCSIDQRWELIA